MIVYLDASVLVKRHVTEPGSAAVNAFRADAAALGTSVITRAEVAAALGTAARMRAVPETDAAAVLEATFDGQLWNAAAGSGFVTWPDTI